MGLVGNCQFCLSFYLHTNISDENIRLAPHFILCRNIPDAFSGDSMDKLKLKHERGRVVLFRSFTYLRQDLLRK